MSTGPLMTRWRRRLVQATALALWISGLSWLGLHYCGVRQGAFGPEAHPAEVWVIRTHGALAFVAVALVGYMWALHVGPGWARGARRRSGGTITTVAMLLLVTGYFLYYGDEQLRVWSSLAHSIAGVLAAGIFLAHRHWKPK